MDDVLWELRTDEDDASLLAGCLLQAPDGIDLAYRLLDRVAERDRVGEPSLVLHPARLGPQVFVRGGVPPTADDVATLLGRGRGLHADDARLMTGIQPVVAASCERALDADVTASADGAVGGLASRPSLDIEVARAAACGARYGWPVTALLLALAGADGPFGGWDALCRAVLAATRVGDLVGVAGPGRILALLGNGGPGVGAPFLERVRAALGAPGVEGAPPPGVVTATANVPAETVDPEEVWRLLDERLLEHGGALGTSGEHWSGAVPSSLELQLRALPGVVAVGTSARGAVGGPQLTVVALEAGDHVHAAASRLVAQHFGDGAVPLVTVGASPPSGPSVRTNGATNGHERATLLSGSRAPTAVPSTNHTRVVVATGERRALVAASGVPRVALLTARFDPVTGTSEVALGRDGDRAVGRATAGPLAGGAQATLAALGVLGVDVPFYLRSVARARDLPGEPVVVVLAPRHPPADGLAQSAEGDRVGVAGGDGEVEAASRATLGALNRFLFARPELRSADRG